MKLMNFLPSEMFAAELQHLNHSQISRLFKLWFAMMMGDDSLQTVSEVASVLLEMPAFDRAADYLKKDPDCATLIQERYIPASYNLDQLLTYAPDSLGYQFAVAMKKVGFDPDLHAGMTADSDAKYVELRLSQTHDIWHVITGFDVSKIGEIGLQAFHLPQFPYPLATVLLANSLMSSTLLAPQELPQLIEAIAQGFAMGKAAKPLFAQRWEEGWQKPLAQWQSELNIQPIQNPVGCVAA